MCGAVYPHWLIRRNQEGSSPRVRSRLHAPLEALVRPRITSACAEQTPTARTCSSITTDHLRVCGADLTWVWATSRRDGSPPRVRSRPTGYTPVFDNNGITSACAEQTGRDGTRKSRGTDHLRVCGADHCRSKLPSSPGGSPPRVRSRHQRPRRPRRRRRITSACAEQTPRRAPQRRPHEDHLRVCGADLIVLTVLIGWIGSPPRVRSRP